MKFEAIRNFIFSCPALDPNAPVYTDFISDQPISYGLAFTIPEEISRDIIGNKTIRQGYMLYPKLETVTDKQRIANQNQLYGFWEWINEQGEQDQFPDSAEQGETIQRMYATNPALMGLEGGTANGLYQCQIYFEYQKEA